MVQVHQKGLYWKKKTPAIGFRVFTELSCETLLICESGTKISLKFLCKYVIVIIFIIGVAGVSVYDSLVLSEVI